MTVYSSEFYTDWLSADGSNKTWPFNFRILTATDVVLQIRVPGAAAEDFNEVTTGFTFNPNSSFTSGTITYPSSGSALLDGSKIRIVRTVPYTQPTEIGSEGSFDPKLHEESFDRLTMQTQQLANAMTRAIKSPLGEVAPSYAELLGTVLEAETAAVAAAVAAAAAQAAAELAAEAASLREPTIFSLVGDGTLGPYDVGANIASDSAIMVAIDGVTQRVGDDYTYMGSNITFTELVPETTNFIHGFVFAQRGINVILPESIDELDLTAALRDKINEIQTTQLSDEFYENLFAIEEDQLAGALKASIFPLALFNGDGVTNDDANFTALRVAWPYRKFDLEGKIYLVTSIPSGPFFNGFFKLGDYLYPTDALVKRSSMVTAGDLYSSWPQDQLHEIRGALYQGFGQGLNHGTNDNDAMIAVSYNRGLTWETSYETALTHATYSAACFAMGALHNAQWGAFRLYDKTTEAVISYNLHYRKMRDQRLLATPFSTTIGSNVVVVTWPVPHGIITGDTVNITSSGSPGGVVVSGDYSATKLDDTTFSVAGTGNASATLANTGGPAVAIRIPTSTWHIKTFGGNSLGIATQAASGAGDLPVGFQSLVGIEAQDAIFMGVSGNGQNGIVRVDNCYGPSTLTYFPHATAGMSETAICSDGTYLYGTRRENSDGQPPGFLWAENIFGTLIQHESLFPIVFSTDNPLPIRYHAPTDMLYIVTQERGLELSGIPQNNPVWLLCAKASEARVSGAMAFKGPIKIDELHISAAGYMGNIGTNTNVGSGTGVGSLHIDGDRLIATFGEESEKLISALVPVVNVRMIEIDISTPIIS